MFCIEQQSPEIAGGVHIGRKLEDIGAGDQGHMFGYATDETEEMMPLTHVLATKLCKALSTARRSGEIPWLRPDGKTQVTCEYKIEGPGRRVVPQRVHTIVISTQHDETVTNEQIEKDLMEKIIIPTIPSKYMHPDVKYYLNPSGKFVIGGPQGDAGTTGRKIIIDSYGGWGAHGGGAYSGKDATKVDRSAAYAARWVAKSIVSAGLAHRCLVQIAYAIGLADPMSLFIDTYGTGKFSDERILEIVKSNFNLRPGVIIQELKLQRPIYFKTASFGHFGRNDPDFEWEKPKELKF